jgi:hypothetical protein
VCSLQAANIKLQESPTALKAQANPTAKPQANPTTKAQANRLMPTNRLMQAAMRKVSAQALISDECQGGGGEGRAVWGQSHSLLCACMTPDMC